MSESGVLGIGTIGDSDDCIEIIYRDGVLRRRIACQQNGLRAFRSFLAVVLLLWLANVQGTKDEQFRVCIGRLLVRS
jgi:hypothetical protein